MKDKIKSIIDTICMPFSLTAINMEITISTIVEISRYTVGHFTLWPEK